MKFAIKTAYLTTYMLIDIFGIQAFCHAEMSSDKTLFEKVKQDSLPSDEGVWWRPVQGTRLQQFAGPFQLHQVLL